MAGSRTRSVHEDVAACNTSGSYSLSSGPFTNKAAAHVRHNLLRHYEHGSRRDSQISTEQEYVDPAGATPSLPAKKHSTAKRTPGIAAVYSEDDTLKPSCRIFTHFRRQPYEGTRKSSVRRNSRRNSQKVRAASKEGAATPCSVPSPCRAGSPSRRSLGETRDARQGLQWGACVQTKQTQQHRRPLQTQQDVRQPRQSQIRERLLQRRRGGVRSCGADRTETPNLSAYRRSSREGPLLVSAAVCFAEDTVSRVCSVLPGAAAHADTIAKSSVSSTPVDTTRGAKRRRDVTGASRSGGNAGEAARAAGEMPRGEGGVSASGLPRGVNSRSASCTLPVVAPTAQHGTAKTLTIRSARTVDAHEDKGGGHRALSTPSRETSFFSSVLSSALSNSPLSVSSSVPQHAGRSPRLRPLQPRPTGSDALDAPSLVRPAADGDACSTFLSVVPASRWYSLAHVPSDRISRTVSASTSRNIPGLHQLQAFEQLPLFRKLVAEAAHAHWERRQRKLKIIRQQQQQHAHLRRLLEQHARQFSGCFSLSEKASECDVVCRISPVMKQGRVLKKDPRLCTGNEDSRRRICAPSTLARAARATGAYVAAPVRTPAFSTLRHVLRVRVASRTAAGERPPRHTRASLLRNDRDLKECSSNSSSSRATSRHSVSNENDSRRPSHIQRLMAQRIRKKITQTNPISGSLVASCATSAQATTACSSYCSQQRGCSRDLSSAVSASSEFDTLEAWGLEGRSTLPNRAADDACVSHRKVDAEPRFRSCPPASSERRHHHLSFVSSKVRSFYSQPFLHCASRLAPVSDEAFHVPSAASASAAVPPIITEVAAAAAGVKTESGGLTTPAEPTAAAASDEPAVKSSLFKQASSVNTSCENGKVLTAGRDGLAYTHLSSNASRSADTAWGGDSEELLGSHHVTKQEKRESQQLLSLALCSSAAITETLGISSPRERYWELYNANQRGVACSGSPLRRMHRLQQQHEQQRVQRQQRRHVEQKRLQHLSALSNEDKRVLTLRAAESSTGKEENSRSSVYAAGCSSNSSLAACASCEQEWKSRHLEPRTGAVAHRDTRAAAGIAGDTQPFPAAETEGNTCALAAGIPSSPFQRKSRSAAASPAAAAIEAEERRKRGRALAVSAFGRPQCLPSLAVTSARSELPLSEAAAARRWEQNEVHSLKKKQAQHRAGHEQLLQYFHQQLLEHFQLHPLRRDRATGAAGKLLCAGYPDSYVGASLERENRLKEGKRQTSSSYEKAEEADKRWNAISLDVPVLTADECLLQSHNLPAPAVRLQVSCQRRAAAGRRAGVGAACGAAARLDTGAAVESSHAKRLLYDSAARQSAAGTAEAPVATTAAPTSAVAGERRAISPASVCEDVALCLTSKAAPVTGPQSSSSVSPPLSSSQTTAAGPTLVDTAAARALVAGQLNAPADRRVPSVVSLPISTAASLALPVASAVAASSVGAAWPPASVAWPGRGCITAAASHSSLLLQGELTQKEISMAARLQQLERQRRTPQANDKMYASSVNVVSSRDRARSSNRSKTTVDNVADTVKASVSGQACTSPPFAALSAPFPALSASRTAVATEYDAHFAEDDRNGLPPSAVKRGSSVSNKGFNSRRNTGLCNGNRSNSGSRTTSNRKNNSEDSSSRTKKSSTGCEQQFQIRESSERSAKGQSSSDKEYVLLFSHNSEDSEENTTSVVVSDKPQNSSSLLLRGEMTSEQRKRNVLAAEAGTAQDGKEAAGALTVTSAGQTDYSTRRSENRAADPGTKDSWREFLRGAREQVVEECSTLAFQPGNKRGAEREGGSTCSCLFFPDVAGYATENTTDRGLSAEREPRALQLQETSEGSRSGAPRCLGLTQVGAYELQGTYCSAPAFHALRAQGQPLGAWTAAAETGSSTAGAAVEAAAAGVPTGAARFSAPVSCSLTATAFMRAAAGAGAAALAASAAKFANATRTAAEFARPALRSASVAAHAGATRDISVRTAPTAFGIDKLSVAKGVAMAGAVSSVPPAAPITAMEREAATLETTANASSAAGGNLEVAEVAASDEEVSQKCSGPGTFNETSSCRSSERKHVLECGHKKERFRNETHDNEGSSENQPHKCTEGIHKGAHACIDPPRPAATPDGMAVSSTSATDAVSNFAGSASALRGDCTRAAYPGVRESRAHSGAASVSSAAGSVGGGAAPGGRSVAVGAEIPRDDGVAAGVEHLPRRHPVPSEMSPASSTVRAYASSSAYGSSAPHVQSRSLLASGTNDGETTSERPAAACAVPSCKGTHNGSTAVAAPCLAAALTAYPADPCSSGSLASAFSRVFSAAQHSQKRQRHAPPQQQCLKQYPAPREHLQQQTQQQHQLHQQSGLQQQRQYPEQHPQPQQYPQQEKQQLQQQSPHRRAQERQLQEQLESLQQPSHGEFLDLQRPPSQQPQQQGWHALEKSEQERTQLRPTQQQKQQSVQQVQPAEDELHRPLVMRAALSDSLTATHMSTSLFVRSNCSSGSDMSRDSITTAAGIRSTGSPWSCNPSPATRSPCKAITGASAPGSTHVPAGSENVSASATDLAAAGSYPAKADPAAAGCARVTASTKELGLSDCSLVRLSPLGWEKNYAALEQQEQTARGASQECGDETAVPPASSARTISTAAAKQTAVASPAEAAGVTPAITHLASASAAQGVTQTNFFLDNEREPSFYASKRDEANYSPASADNIARLTISASLASLPSLGGSSEEARLTQLLRQLLQLVLRQPRSSTGAPVHASAESEAQERHALEKRTAAAAAAAALTGTVAAACRPAAGADGQSTSSSSGAHCKTSGRNPAESKLMEDVNGAPVPTTSGNLAGTVLGGSTGTCTVGANNSGKRDTGLQCNNSGNAFAAMRRSSNIDSCNSVVAGSSSSSGSSARSELGKCDAGLAAMRMRPSSPPPRPGGTVISEATAAVDEFSSHEVAATYPDAEAGAPSTAAAAVFTAVAATHNSVARAALDATTATAPTAVVGRPEFKGVAEVACSRSAAVAPAPIRLPEATGSAGIRTGRIVSAMGSSTLAPKGGRQSIVTWMNTLKTDTATVTQLQKVPSVEFSCRGSCSNSGITRGLTAQQQHPSPPAFREYGHLPVLIEGGGIMKTNAFMETRGTRRGATTASDGTAAVSWAVPKATANADAAGANSRLLTARGSMDAAIPEPLRLSRTLGASADAFSEETAGAEHREHDFVCSPPAVSLLETHVAADADAVRGPRATNNVRRAGSHELTVSRTAFTAEKDLFRGVANGFRESCKQTHRLRSLLLSSLVGMLSLDDSVLLPLLRASPSNSHRLDCTGTTEGGSRSCSGTAVATRRQNSESSSSTSNSCSGCDSDDPQGGKCADKDTPLSLLLSSAAAGVATATAGDWMRTLPLDFEEAAAIPISLLRQWSRSTQLSYSASPCASLQIHRQQQLQGPHGPESLSMRQQRPPLQCPNQLAVRTEDPQRQGQEQQSREQQRPWQRVGENHCDSDGVTEHAHQQHKVAREIFHSAPVLQNLQLTDPRSAAAATPVRMATISDCAAVYDNNPGVTVASSTLSPDAVAATAAPGVSDTPAFSAVVEPSRYASPGGGRSLSLSQLQQASPVGSLSVQDWEGQRLQPQQQREQQFQLKQHQLRPKQEAPARPPEIQQLLRECRSSNCAAERQSCCPTSAALGVMQLSEEERSGVADVHTLLHAQQLQKRQVEQQLAQGTHQVEQVEAGASRRTLQVTCLDKEKRHPQAPRQSVQRQDEAFAWQQQQGRQQHHQHPYERHNHRETQLHLLQHHRLLQRLRLERTLHKRMEELSETDATAAEEKALNHCSTDGMSDANVALMEPQQRATRKGKDKQRDKTKGSRSTNTMERPSRGRHSSSKGPKCTSTRDSRKKHSVTRGRRSSRRESCSTRTRRRRGSRVQQKSSRSTSAATHGGMYWDSDRAPSAKRTGRADHCIGEESTRRTPATPLARVRSTSDTAEAGAVASRNAGVPVAESARHTPAGATARLPVPIVTTSGRCVAVVAATGDPFRLSSSVVSTHSTGGDRKNKQTWKKKLQTSRVRRQCKNHDVTTVNTLHGSDALLAATTFAVERSFTPSVAAATAAAVPAQHRLPEVSRLFSEEDGAHVEHALQRQQQRVQSERQKQLQRCQWRTRPKTQYSPSPRQQHGEDQEGKGTKNVSKEARSRRGNTKSWEASRENMDTRATGHDAATHFWNKEATNHVGDSSTSCMRRSRHRQDSSTQTRGSSTEVSCRTSYGNRSTSDNKHSDCRAKRSTSHQHHNSSRHQVNNSSRHTSSISDHVECSRRQMSFTRTRRTNLKKRLLATSTSPGEADTAEQLLPMLRKHLQQQRELHEELQQVERQLAGLHLLNSLTAFSGGVSCSAPTRIPAETEAQEAAALEGRSAHSDKHYAERRSRRDDDTSSSCDGHNRARASSTCEENGRPSSSSSSADTSYYTPVSVSTASAAAVQRGEGTGSNRVTQPPSVKSSQFDAAEEAAGHSCTFPCCTHAVPTAEACPVASRSISRSSSRSAASSRSDSCERIMGKELLELSGGKLGLATVKRQLREACFPSKASCEREKSITCRWDSSEEAGCFSTSASFAAGGADCVATFSRKLALQQPLCAGQAAVANKSRPYFVKEEAVRRVAHLGISDEQTAATAAERQMKRRAVLQGLQNVELQQQQLRNGDAVKKWNVDCPFFRRGKEGVQRLSVAKVSGDDSTHWLDFEVTHGRKKRANTRRQRTSDRGALAWLDYTSAGSTTSALTSPAEKPQQEPRQNQQQRLKHLKPAGRNLPTSLLLDSETDGVTEGSVSEQPLAYAGYS